MDQQLSLGSLPRELTVSQTRPSAFGFSLGLKRRKNGAQMRPRSFILSCPSLARPSAARDDDYREGIRGAESWFHPAPPYGQNDVARLRA